MISLTWTNANFDSVTFSRDSEKYRLLLDFDLGDIPDVNHLTTRGAYQEGETPLDAIYEPRDVTLPIQIYGTDLADLKTNVRALFALLDVSIGTGSLLLVDEDGSEFRLICSPGEKPIRLGKGTQNKSQTFWNATLTFRAFDPFWKSGSPYIVYLAPGGSPFFPLRFPFSLSPVS